MAKISGWNRVFWQNASGDNVLNRLDEPLPDQTLAAYQNARGVRITYGYAPDDAPGKYNVLLDDEPVKDFTLRGEKFNDEHFEELVFDTRARAREAATQLMRQLPTLETDDDGEYDYDDLQSWAKALGHPANQSAEDLAELIGV